MCYEPEPNRSPDAPPSRHLPLDEAILARLTDAHCHPSDDSKYTGPTFMTAVKLGTVCAMSSTLQNQKLISELHEAFPARVIPFYGVHPWFVHSLSTSKELPSHEEHYSTLFPPTPTLASLLPILPRPTLLSEFLATLATSFELNPRAMLGEVGLDKWFHLRRTTEARGPLSDLATPIQHQVQVVEAQIDVALRLGRNISFHSVRASKDTLELLDRCKRKDRWDEINICLHSFGGSPESIRDIQKAHHNAYFSFATAITGRSPRFADLVRAVDTDRLLVESDGPARFLDEWVWRGFEAIRAARGWTTEECVGTLERNWARFCEPPGPPPPKPLSKREKKEQALLTRTGLAR